jgi:hypothetical protein
MRLAFNSICYFEKQKSECFQPAISLQTWRPSPNGFPFKMCMGITMYRLFTSFSNETFQYNNHVWNQDKYRKGLLIKSCAHDRSSSRVGLMNTFKQIFTLDADSLSQIKRRINSSNTWGTRTHVLFTRIWKWQTSSDKHQKHTLALSDTQTAINFITHTHTHPPSTSLYVSLSPSLSERERHTHTHKHTQAPPIL